MQTGRIYQLHLILAKRRMPIPLDALVERMRCSSPTVFRLLKTLEEQLRAPIIRDKDRSYRYDTTKGTLRAPGPLVHRQ